MRTVIFSLALCISLSVCLIGQSLQPDIKAFEEETMRHYQALLRLETMDPPGNEKPAADYLKQVLEKERIETKTFSLEANRPNVVARLKGNGRKRPLLIMAHTDVVNVDPAKWTFPPFSATRNGGYVYGRGTVDDKDNVVAALMTAFTLKRLNVPLDRDVIFLFEAGEEGSTRVGIQFMVNQHYSEIDSEFCLAEGVPLKTNAVVHLAEAVAAVAKWRTPIRINETTGAYFSRLEKLSKPEEAHWYRDILSTDPKKVEAADDYFLDKEPRHASMLRSSISPNQFNAGYRINVIPSEAKAL